MKFKLPYVIPLLVLLMSSCKSKNERANLHEMQSFIHDTFRVDPSLRAQADLIMEGQLEVSTFDDIVNKDTTNKRKKSSNVKIVILRDDINEIEMTDELRCVANLKRDTLNIDISINSGFSGKGVSIKYIKDKVSTDIYEFTDMVYPNEKEPKLTIEKQKLALNKSRFATGDSLYGHIYARIISDNKVRYYANGFFRAKITASE